MATGLSCPFGSSTSTPAVTPPIERESPFGYGTNVRKVLNRKEKAFKRSPTLVPERLNDQPLVEAELLSRMPSRFDGYILRGRWFKENQFGGLRNAAWMLRNSRAGQAMNPAALTLVIHEAQKLLSSGEPLGDVLEAFAELLIHP
jgi:hypothetical protein